MSEPQPCPQCGSEIPDGAPAGLCPKCLMLVGLESRPPADPGTAATQPQPSSARAGFVPLTVEEVAAKIPRLEIIELLGRGGMGAVYKARQRQLDRLVAVKILPPEITGDPAFAERFNREARAMARLSHPNIVALLEISRTADGLIYFVMEYVDGVNLRQAIQAGHMEPAQALAIVPQICDALQFAHDEGVVHRDIKPENILIDKRGRVKIADFGLAKLLGQESVDRGLTATQQVMGTLRYMAPEQMEGAKSVDHRADIYSLGVVFYELLTGELPIGRFAPPSKMVEIDVRLDEVVLRALEKKPEQRYQQASEVKTAVEDVSRGASFAPAATSSPTRRFRIRDLPDDLKWQTQKKLLWLAAGCLTSFAAGLAAIIAFWPGAVIEAFEFDYQPKSKAFRLLVVQGEFHGTKLLVGPVLREQSASLPLRVTVVGNDNSRSALTVELPSLRATFPTMTVQLPLDRDEWLRWLKDRHVDTTNPAVQKEADAFISLLKRYNILTPTTLTEFESACRESLTDYIPYGSVETGLGVARFGAGFFVGIVLLYLGLCLIFLIIALPIKKAAFLRGRDFLAAGKIEAARSSSSPLHDAAQAAAAADARNRVLLLDETDRAARRTQHVIMLLGTVLIVLGGYCALPLVPGLWPLSILSWLFGIPCMVFAGLIRQQWEIDYMGHSVRFENSVYTSGRLTIDGKTMASGGVKWINTEISARIPRGAGTGDRIFVKTNPDFLSFRCRIFVEPKSATVPTAAATPTAAAASTAGAHPPSEPRLSRMAVAGAIWAPFAVILVLTWLAFGGGQPDMKAPQGYVPPSPPWWQVALMVALIPPGFSAPFGTTILGSIALTQIRHSAARLYGLGLALFDALLYPIVVIDFLIWWVIGKEMREKLMHSQLDPNLWLDIGPMIAATVAIVAVDAILIRFELRIAQAPMPARGSQAIAGRESPKGNQP